MTGWLRQLCREMPAAIATLLLALLVNFLVAQTHRQIGHPETLVVHAGDHAGPAFGDASLGEDCPLCAAASSIDPMLPWAAYGLPSLIVEQFLIFQLGVAQHFAPSHGHGWNSRAPPRG